MIRTEISTPSIWREGVSGVLRHILNGYWVLLMPNPVMQTDQLRIHHMRKSYVIQDMLKRLKLTMMKISSAWKKSFCIFCGLLIPILSTNRAMILVFSTDQEFILRTNTN